MLRKVILAAVVAATPITDLTAQTSRCWVGPVSNTYVKVCATISSDTVSGVLYAEYENSKRIRVNRPGSPSQFSSSIAADGSFNIGRAYHSMRFQGDRLIGVYDGDNHAQVNLGPSN